MKKTEIIAKTIKKFNNFLIVSHINPEGDSLGSQLAMASLLKCLGKNCVIYNHDKAPDHYQFLPGIKLVRYKTPPKKENFDAAIILDCPNLSRTGRVKSLIKKVPYIINIDHHVSNENFGNSNWVEKNISSAGEMVFKLFKEMDCKITKEVALCLYISILTDTGSFNYSNTSSATHEIISELLGCGVEPYDVSKSVYGNKSVGDLKLLGKVLSELVVLANGKIAYMVVRKSLFRLTKTQPVSCENFVNFARSIHGVEVAAFFREDIKGKNMFHVSFRSTTKIDVNKIASSFGGGGHKSASGCTIRGNFSEVKKKVLGRIKREL